MTVGAERRGLRRPARLHQGAGRRRVTPRSTRSSTRRSRSFVDTDRSTPERAAGRRRRRSPSRRSSATSPSRRTWPEVTDCDRLDAAFAELDTRRHPGPAALQLLRHLRRRRDPRRDRPGHQGRPARPGLHVLPRPGHRARGGRRVALPQLRLGRRRQGQRGRDRPRGRRRAAAARSCSRPGTASTPTASPCPSPGSAAAIALTKIRRRRSPPADQMRRAVRVCGRRDSRVDALGQPDRDLPLIHTRVGVEGSGGGGSGGGLGDLDPAGQRERPPPRSRRPRPPARGRPPAPSRRSSSVGPMPS